MMTENYVYKKEVDWSLLTDGITLPVDNQVIFGQIMGRFLQCGESKDKVSPNVKTKILKFIVNHIMPLLLLDSRAEANPAAA